MFGVDNSGRNWYTCSRHLGRQLIQFLDRRPQLVYCVRNVMAHGDALEGKWRGNWRMEWVASTLTRPRNVVYPPLLPLMRTLRLPAVDWTDSPSDLNGLVRLGERRNVVSARVPSGSARALLPRDRWHLSCLHYLLNSFRLLCAQSCRDLANYIFSFFSSSPGATQSIVGVHFTALYRDLASSRTRLLYHPQRRATVGRNPLNEWSVRRRDLYLTTHNTHNRQTSMPRVGLEPTIAAGERP